MPRVGAAAGAAASNLIVVVLGIMFWRGHVGEHDLWFGVYQIGPAQLHPLVLPYGVSGSAMISATLRIPKP